MPGILHSRTLTVAIDRPPDEVYEYIANPENFPAWANSFCLGVRKAGDGWVAETREGPMSLRFADRNGYGILDHYLKKPSQRELLNPMRVVPYGSGSKVIFTVFQRDESFVLHFRDAEKDLQTLKNVLENK
ncbi:SRPBCC family protein [Cohnella thermotolerans]|uniref:SRPBCC family protein n=1 Tax=Cohnella thermotolerans TaxID=329858 RepID=UPI00040101DB|nr:SRPBCC family protein [Cohnella thermotolerans]